MTTIQYISQLGAAAAAASTDIFPVSQGSTGPLTGTTRKLTVAQLFTSSALTGTTTVGSGLANYLTVTGAAASGAPTITAAGSDTNISISLTPKGTGNVIITGAAALRGSYGGGGITSNFSAGDGALQANTTGNSNTAIGFEALRLNTTGISNTAIGYYALRTNTTGFNNTAYGNTALFANTTGYQNTAVGVGALYSNSTGIRNTASGHQSLEANTTGYDNVASGFYALRMNTTGFYNTAVGRAALSANTTGLYNSAVGYGALVSNTTGSLNTAVGAGALGFNTTGSGNTAISPMNSAGTHTPVFEPTVENNRFCMGSTSVSNAYIQVAWTVVSDARDKTDFAPVPHGLDFVSKLAPTAYRYKMNREDTEGHGPIRYGFKAQDVLALEGSSSVIVDAEDLDKLRFNDQSMIAVLVKALQELNAKFVAYVATHP